jgi:hypothetical protein
MNVFQKVLLKVFEISGGKDNVEVDLADLLKKEGFYSNIESISGQLQDEGWITEAGRKHVIKITHWGAMEAKRLQGGASVSSGGGVEKEANVLVNESKTLVNLLEEFATSSDPKKLDAVDKSLSSISEKVKTLRGRL